MTPRPPSPRVAAAVVLALVSVCPAGAATLAEYAFTGGSAASSAAAAGVTAGAFTKGAGVSGASFATHDLARIGTNSLAPSTAEGSVTGSAYYSFTLTIAEGHALALASLSFDAVTYGTETNVSANYKGACFVRSSLDNYATTLGTEAVRSYVYPGAGAPAPSLSGAGHAVDLTDASFQSLTGSITFRIYLYDYNGTPGTGLTSPSRFVALDNVVLDGSVSAIPEPSAFAAPAGAVALLAAGFLRRRPAR